MPDQHDKLCIEGYTDQLSIEAGQSIGLCISTNAGRYSIEVARVGARRDVVWQKEDVAGTEFPVPDDASTQGCNWPLALKVPVPDDWRSGYYSVIMQPAGPGGRAARGEMSFVVRSARPGRDTKILLQRTTNTDNAYNTWGGTSLYTGPEGPGHRVSFDRPFAGFREGGEYLFSTEGLDQEALDNRNIPASLKEAFASQGLTLSESCFVSVGQYGRSWYVFDAGAVYSVRKAGSVFRVYDSFTRWESCWHRWELPFVQWLEDAGYRVDYAVNSDLEFHPEILRDYRLVLSVGHDEYWSSPMRDRLEDFVASGGNVAFFSGNALFWQVRSEQGGRDLVCFKDHKQDPLYQCGDHRLLTTLWCHRLIGRPENRLTGVSFAYGGYHRFFDQFQDGPSGYTVHRPDHWIFQGTGLKRGNQLGTKDMIVSYECDGCELRYRAGMPFATGHDGTPKSFEVLATAPAGLTHADNSLNMVIEALHGEVIAKSHPQPGAAVLGTYTQGGTVFTCGCTNWSHGLRGRDAQVQRITGNILDRLSK